MSEETIPQMREQIDSLTKQLKDANKTIAAQATENRVLTARDVFGSQGYDPAAGELFAAQNPEGDITDEAVTGFVEKYGVGKGAPSGDGDDGDSGDGEAGGSDSDPAPGSADLAHLGRGGSGAGDGGAGGASSETLTRQEWQELMARDPAAGRAAVRQGKVQISKDNVYSDIRPGPGNPYATSE